jgi:hypothetical protein
LDGEEEKKEEVAVKVPTPGCYILEALESSEVSVR